MTQWKVNDPGTFLGGDRGRALGGDHWYRGHLGLLVMNHFLKQNVSDSRVVSTHPDIAHPRQSPKPIVKEIPL